MNTVLLAAMTAMADTAPGDIDPTTGQGPEWGKAAPVGLLVILLMCIATFFLLRSMTRKIKAVPESFDSPQPSEVAASGADAAAKAPPAVSPADPPDLPAGPESGGPPGLVDDRTR